MRRFSIGVLLFFSGFAVLPCPAADVYRQLVPLPRGIVPAKVAARVSVARLKSPEVTFGAVAGLVDGDIGCGVGAVFKTAPAHVADQAYRIDIGPDGVKVVAGGEAGARYARVTLDQLAKLTEDGTVPAGAIIDWPALKWRGIMNDCGRNFLDLEGVKAIVDLAARYKLNLFHWHLSEYHGWRLESKRYPKLTAPETMLRQIGKYYTQDDFRAVVAYAAERGVTVMPELDVPGHSLALRKGLGVESMKDPRVDRAVSDLLDELCTLAPKDVMPFIHLGTDEVRVTPERVDAGQCSRWAEIVAKNGRIAVGWAPGERMSSSGEIVDMVWEGGHPTNSTHRCFDAADFYFGSLGPELILNQAQFAKPCDWAIAPERKLGAIACCWHDDAVGEDTMRLFRNTAFAPALVAFADNFWLGRPKREQQFFTRLPPHGSMALGYTEYFENRLLAQRDKVLKDCPLPFPYVRQTQYRWRVTDGTGRVIDGCYPGGLFDVDSFVTNRTGLVVAETWIESQEDRTVGAWIDFEKTGTTHVRSFNRPRPKLGEWSPLGSTVEVNGEKVAPPAWRHPGVYANFDKLPKDGHCWLYRDVPYSDEVCEAPIDDEWHFVREPTRIRLRKGWNHVKLTMPKDVDALEPVWRGVFLLLEGSSERPREVKGLRFSSDPQPEGATPLDVQGLLDCARPGETVRIAAGTWQTKPFRLRSDVTLALDEGAVVYASTDIRDYSETAGQRYFIRAVGVTNAAIVGKGVFDGCGQQFNFEEVLAGESQPQKLPVMMRFIRCKNLRLEGFTYRNGGAWGCHLCNCDGVTVRGLTCFNHSNRTNDGIDIESSNVLIEGCDIDADDDAIVLKAETDVDFPVTNVVIRNCRLASSCNAFKFGTGSYNAFRDVLLENCEFVPPKGNFVRGIRPSDSGEWTLTGIAGMALEVCDGGIMENVTIRNVTVRGYLTPVFVRLERRHAPRGGRETYLRNVLIENVRGRAESPIASSITGVPGLRPRDITLRNCDFTFPGGGTAKDAAMPVSECETAYPDCTMFDNRRLPAWGFYIRHADNVRFENVKLSLTGPDARERIVTDDCGGFVEVPPAGNGEPLIFSMGIMTDTHVGSWFTKDASHVRMAAEFFRREGVGTIVNVGDICDRHEPRFYQMYREAVDGVFPLGKPRPTEIFVYAWHDAYAYKGHARSEAVRDSEAAFRDVRRYLRAVNPPEYQTEIAGYPIVVFQQFDKLETHEKTLKAVEEKYPDKPIFVFDHVPVGGTVDRSADWGSETKLPVYSRHPRVIHVSGHVHGSLRNERNIWQGAFTAVNCGCLQVWGRDRVRSYDVMTMEVREHSVTFRRFDLRDGSEIGADARWTVPLPFDPATAPFRPDVRRKDAPTPEFGDGKPVFRYRARVTGRAADGRAADLYEGFVEGDYHLRPSDRTGEPPARFFPASAVEPGEKVRLEVTPLGFFGQEGRPRVSDITGPVRTDGSEAVFESRNPTDDLAFYWGDAAGDCKERAVAKEGVFRRDGRLIGLLQLPASATDPSDGRKIRVTVEFTTRSVENDAFSVGIAGMEKPDGRILSRAIRCRPGDAAVKRVVHEFAPRVDVPDVGVYVYTSAIAKPCGVRFERIRVERFDGAAAKGGCVK